MVNNAFPLLYAGRRSPCERTIDAGGPILRRFSGQGCHGRIQSSFQSADHYPEPEDDHRESGTDSGEPKSASKDPCQPEKDSGSAGKIGPWSADTYPTAGGKAIFGCQI